MKRKNGRRCLCFALLAVLLFLFASSALRLNNVKDTMHIQGFFKEPKDTIDVIAIGASEIYTSLNSPLAWEEYGFTSYSVSFAGAPGSLYKAMLKEALNRQNPEVVVIEINGFLNGDKYLEKDAKKHTWFDNVPWSSVKWESMQELISKDKMAEYLVDFIKYHDNWRHPLKCGKNFYWKVRLALKGISDVKCFGTTTLYRGDVAFKDFTPKYTEKTEAVLVDLLEYCKEQGLDQVLFLRTPHCINNKTLEVYDRIEELVTSYGYDFLNLESSFEEVGLDPAVDFYNKDHMNTYGMEKMTEYLGEWITTHYELPQTHSDKLTQYWDQCAEKMHVLLEKSKVDLDNGKKVDYYEISGI
ncbi:MAG: hypothetical protein IJV50_06765 [Lachnospiraceae bacterium]|nr:hypothetical protein [Lachnospiraceae bacterium]